MEWPGDSPDDRTLVAPVPPNVSSDIKTEKFLKNTKEKLIPNTNRSVRCFLYVGPSSYMQSVKPHHLNDMVVDTQQRTR